MSYNNNRPLVYAPQKKTPGYYPENRPQPKRSGVKYSRINKGNYSGYEIVNAWKKTKQGLITCKVSPYRNTEEFKGDQNGNTYIKMIATVTYPSGITKLIPCNMNKNTKVIVLSDVGMCITPNGQGHTSTGKFVKGYFGKFTR